MPSVVFQGSAGRLEGRYTPSFSPNAAAVLIAHPHPQHGGSMHHKVVHTLYRSFYACGFSVLRFNFRGVGNSEGTYDNGDGELSDAASAFNWLQTHHQGAPRFWIAGFSFGAWIGMQLLMRRPELFEFVMVSPPTNLFDFSFLSPCPTPGLIIQGQEDEIVQHTEVYSLVQKLNQQRHMCVEYSLLKEADHFFTKHLKELEEHVTSYLTKCRRPVSLKTVDSKSVA